MKSRIRITNRMSAGYPEYRDGKAFAFDIEAVAGYIANQQYVSGEVPWFKGHKTDPWDHVESLMGLSVGGFISEARKGFDWLAATQLPEGGWYSAYNNGVPVDRTVETNFSAYIAVGVYHHYLVTGDKKFVKTLWPSVKSAIRFVCGLQSPDGGIYWAISPEGHVDRMSLLTGSSSVYKSLSCAIELSEIVNDPQPGWAVSMQNLKQGIRLRPHQFNINKSRYSMDWFYPVLSGAIEGTEAWKRIKKHWNLYVVEGLGVRCVWEQPWITIAETSELVLALCAIGDITRARTVFDWIRTRHYDDHAFWCGFTFPDHEIWPDDKLTWTNAAVLLASDALNVLTPGHVIFRHKPGKKEFARRFV